ncbi:TetR/AcrR family transcriptional regulator [Ferrimonas futtsuensis]|uniref:TetR/AcrR family transcriptional regulator n=1 Tax=Ferrimonas futtsuensis TaxID=364764 RepID=UPI000407ED75|nr:TetR/AcrR family transcriptional regulator [Ferrimonas futtsuensis]
MTDIACSLEQFQRQLQWQPDGLWQSFRHHCLPQLKQKNPKRTDARLAAIINATFELANLKGFHAMTLRQLSEASGLSLGGLYGYFDSKEALAASIHRFIRIQFEQVLLPMIRALPRQQQLQAICRYHLYLSELMQPWFYFAYMEARHQSDTLRREALALSEQVDDELHRSLMQLGQVEQPVIAVGLLKHLLQGWYLRRSHFRKAGVSVDAYTDYLLNRVQLLCHGETSNDPIPQP